MFENFDQNKREHLSKPWGQFIAQVIQNGLLDEFFKNNNIWTPGDIIFHGGTAINMTLGSVRFSEDLDFIINSEKAELVNTMMNKAREGIEERLHFYFPGCEVSLKEQKELKDTQGEVIRYIIKWSHPNKRGKVVVKNEFYTAQLEQMNNYKRHTKGSANSYIKLDADYAVTSPTMNALIPVATPEMFYADKIVALARRPFYKHRDVYDLWWLGNQNGVVLKDDELYDVMMRSFNIYDDNPENIIEGLQRFQKEGQSFIDEMKENLKGFLSDDMMKMLEEINGFQMMFDHLQKEMIRTEKIIEDKIKNDTPDTPNFSL